MSEGHELDLGEKEVKARAEGAHTPLRHTHRLGGCTARAGQQCRINKEHIQDDLQGFVVSYRATARETLHPPSAVSCCMQAVPAAGPSLGSIWCDRGHQAAAQW